MMKPTAANEALLILVIGLPGTGKTTFSRALAAALDALHLNTDIIRAQTGNRGRYDAHTKREVYRLLLEQATETLRAGRTVIVDGTFYLADLRQPFFELAENTGTPLHWIELEADEAVIRARTSRQRPFSEADFNVYQRIKAEYEPLTDRHLTLRTDGPEALPELVRQAADYIGRPLPPPQPAGYDRPTD